MARAPVIPVLSRRRRIGASFVHWRVMAGPGRILHGNAPADDEDANVSATTMPALGTRHATCRIDGEHDEDDDDHVRRDPCRLRTHHTEAR
ncbi:hypothetical protein QZM35_13500 [Burkholderia sp. AU45274]|uniref:hypothetical protein n=1 Tax=Burkholderia sp. AU45274 TaxID=3059205 RepID=UPI00265709DE|nr:hypothetical protein [Burkholderia sp. AU45274]MDN7488716.1 hypothetical protein [Burkholderia sp. AU45274]